MLVVGVLVFDLSKRPEQADNMWVDGVVVIYLSKRSEQVYG